MRRLPAVFVPFPLLAVDFRWLEDFTVPDLPLAPLLLLVLALVPVPVVLPAAEAGAGFLDVVVLAAPYINVDANARTAADRKIENLHSKNKGQAAKPAPDSECDYCELFGNVPVAKVDDHC